VETLVRYLSDLQGAFVQVERGGPEACQGWLDSVQADYFTLVADCGAELHLRLHHIRSVTPLPTPAPRREARAKSGGRPPTFAELLAVHLGRQVRLNHAGPESCTGELRAVAPDYAVLETNPGQPVCFPLFHIRSLATPSEPPAPPDPDDGTKPAQGG
jgi:hypothetical protein